MRAMFELSYIQMGEPGCKWWEDLEHLGWVLRLMQTAGLLDAVGYVSPRSDDPDWTKFQSVDQLQQMAASWELKTYLLVSETCKDPSLKILLRVLPTSMSIKLIIADLTAKKHAAQLEASLQFVTLLKGDNGHETRIGPVVDIGPIGISVPEPRPPRNFRVLQKSSMVDCFCRTYFDKEASEGRKREVERLLNLEMPDWVERREQGDLVILRWVDRFDDEEHIRERLTRRLVWLIEHLDPPISSNYNEAGDQRANPSAKAESEVLTFYDPIPRHGYKATVCQEDGSVDEELFEQIKKWLEAKETPAGEELRALHLILPSREAALRVRDRAEEAGIEHVLYMGEDGNLWDPFPPGQWLDDEHLT